MGGLGAGGDINSELARALGDITPTATTHSSTSAGSRPSAGACKGIVDHSSVH